MAIIDVALAGLASVAVQLVGTFQLRPYVFGFLTFFLVAALRDLGRARTVTFLLWGGTVALIAELVSTRVGIPFGLYHYTGDTRAAELFLGNVPFFSPLSFPFLAYAAFCLARRTLGPGWAATRAGRVRMVAVSGALMMLLDVVIDPLAVRGGRWFLGHIFYYPDGALQLPGLAGRRLDHHRGNRLGPDRLGRGVPRPRDGRPGRAGARDRAVLPGSCGQPERDALDRRGADRGRGNSGPRRALSATVWRQ